MSVLSLGAVLLTAGCTVGAPRESPIRPTPLPAESRPPSGPPASSPPASSTPTPPVATPSAATATPTPTVAPQSASPSTAPPAAFLEGGNGAVEGWLGSYCWHGLCADVPQIVPKTQLPMVSFGADDLSATLAGGEPFVRWFASYGADGRNLQPLAEGGEPFDPDAVAGSPPPQFTGATFAPPPNGDWVLTVQVFFTEGDAMYAWHALSE